MDAQNFKFNDVFSKNAKEYLTRPVLAAKYKTGMENGWIVRYSNIRTANTESILYEGARFFPTIHDAWDFINANES